MRGEEISFRPEVIVLSIHPHRIIEMKQIGALKITTLAENYAFGRGIGQWGLSLLLELMDAEGDQRKVVLDTGMNGEALFHNAKVIKEDFSDVDCIVLSHGHYDHTATTTEIVKASGGVKVYGHPHTFTERISENRVGKRRRIDPPKGQGIGAIEAAGGIVVLTENPVEVVPGLSTTGEVKRRSFEKGSVPSNQTRWIRMVDGEETDDLILDDLALWTEVSGVGPWVITGCAHAGPVNTLLQVQELSGFDKIFGFIGGTHLIGRPDDYIQSTIEEITKFRPKLISPCHCTGFKATARFWEAFPEEFVLNNSLRIIEAGKMPRHKII
jgi:7,8-dihydropterin-6-yl-methyl-4-(beta-D-ribofuranosyl)aminobenzene 5'-phosphate synthase